MLKEWKPTRGYLNTGRFDYGTAYTIRKPTFEIIDETGRRVAVIQELSGDDGVMQYGDEPPRTLITTALYHLTGYGKGVDADSSAHIRRQFCSAIHYYFGPNHPLSGAVDRLQVRRIEA